MTDEEKWMTIKQNDNYEISNFGLVRNKKTKRVLKPAISNKGYYLVSLSRNCKQHTYTIHKLVMEHFNRCAFDYEVINHKDHNKLNNNIDNLEYITQKENIRDAWENDLCKKVRNQAKINILKASNHTKIKINQYDMNGKFIKQWNYIREVQKELGISNANIIKCCKGERKSAGGYIWKYN